MSCLVTTESRRAYAAQRGVSQGAHITLMASSGGYQARFECAKHCIDTLGAREYEGSGSHVLIPTENLHKCITKLAERFSVALLDTVTDEDGTRFVLIWKIQPTTKAPVYFLAPGEAEKTVTLGAIIPNEINLDEY